MVCAVCCVLCAACCVLRAACCVLRAVCCILGASVERASTSWLCNGSVMALIEMQVFATSFLEKM
jgi:hypothetical protein